MALQNNQPTVWVAWEGSGSLSARPGRRSGWVLVKCLARSPSRIKCSHSVSCLTSVMKLPWRVTDVILLPIVAPPLLIATVTVETLMPRIHRVLGSMLVPNTICPEILRGLLKLFSSKSCSSHILPYSWFVNHHYVWFYTGCFAGILYRVYQEESPVLWENVSYICIRISWFQRLQRQWREKF